MMLDSNAAGRSFTPNGLGDFRPKTRTWAGTRGMGSTLLEQSLAYNWREHLTPETSVFVPTPEWTAYYGSGGTYSQSASVERAEEEEERGRIVEAVYREPSLYATEACSPMDSACVGRNSTVQLANFVLRDNANRAVFMANCMASGRGAECNQYRQVAVPAVPTMAGGAARPLLPGIGGQAQIAGETPEQKKASAEAWSGYRTAATPQQVASSITNQPNQSVPPRPQGGEVAAPGITETVLERLLREELEREAAAGKETAGTGTGAGTGAGFSLVDADGKILGLEPMTLALVAAGAGALLLLKK